MEYKNFKYRGLVAVKEDYINFLANFEPSIVEFFKYRDGNTNRVILVEYKDHLIGVPVFHEMPVSMRSMKLYIQTLEDENKKHVATVLCNAMLPVTEDVCIDIFKANHNEEFVNNLKILNKLVKGNFDSIAMKVKKVFDASTSEEN